tara:strand:+ start:2012 stop:2245 length:234 start_codon:yes stop_codon:yes gene_type:complete
MNTTFQRCYQRHQQHHQHKKMSSSPQGGSQFVEAVCHSYCSTMRVCSHPVDQPLSQSHIGTSQGWMSIKDAKKLGLF